MSSSAQQRALSVSVVVPTYRRPADLRRCVDALVGQTSPADEVVVVVREDDDESLSAVDGLVARIPSIERVTVSAPGQVHALNRGIERAQRGHHRDHGR